MHAHGWEYNYIYRNLHISYYAHIYVRSYVGEMTTAGSMPFDIIIIIILYR